MFNIIKEGFQSAKNILTNDSTIKESNIKEAIEQVKVALLEADVESTVINRFILKITEKILGQTIKTKSGEKKRTTEEFFINTCHEEILNILGKEDEGLFLSKPLGVIMLVGLQGSGKTTTAAKIAYFLKNRELKPMLIAADVYRPAAIEQLKILGKENNLSVYSEDIIDPQTIVRNGKEKAIRENYDVIIIDTAGRLAIDDKLMNELSKIENEIKPDNIYLVIDAMMGQDAVNTAVKFSKKLKINGFILTKMDGDSRGGAAFSIKAVTGIPIKFFGVGEKIFNLERFKPKKLATKLLQMGDLVGLMQDFQRDFDKKKSEEKMKKIEKGKFSIKDYIYMLNSIKKIGTMKNIAEKIPGLSKFGGDKLKENDKLFIIFDSISKSMTKYEKVFPNILNKEENRKKRIALGSGRSIKQVNEFLKMYFSMKDMMGFMNKKNNMLSKIPGMMNLKKMLGSDSLDKGNLDLSNVKSSKILLKKMKDKKKKKKKMINKSKKKKK